AEAVPPRHLQQDLLGAESVEREAVVEKANERTQRAGGVVVLRLAEQERGASLDVAEVDVVAQRRADDAPAGVDDQDELGFGIVPPGRAWDADSSTQPHAGEDRRLREDLGIRPDADLEVLRPEALLAQHALRVQRLGGAGTNRRDTAAQSLDDERADLGGAGGIATDAFLDDPFDQAVDEGDAARLDHLQVNRREQVRAGQVLSKRRLED